MVVPARKTSKVKKWHRHGSHKKAIPAISFDALVGEYRVSSQGGQRKISEERM